MEQGHQNHPPEYVELPSGEEDDSSDSLHLQHAGEEEEEEGDSSDSSSVAYDYRQTSKRCKTLWGRLCSGAPTLALTRGKELQTNLSSEHPSFILQMQQSHVTKKFFLDVPEEFCELHLPAYNVDIILEDENGEIYTADFHPGRVPNLISGWKRFSVAHKLLEDDVLVFHLLRPWFFKVYIIRATEPAIAGSGSANPTSFNVHANEGDKERNSEATGKEVCVFAPDMDIVQESVKTSSSLSNPKFEPGQDHSSTDEFHSSDVMEASPLSKCDADFEGHKHLDNVEAQAREEDEKYSPESSCMVTWKPPSVGNNIPVSIKRVSRLFRKKTYKQVDYEIQRTIKRCLTKSPRMDYEERALALERAKELQTNLSSEHPSFIKQIHSSNVANGRAVVILPLKFCKLHLPNHDAEVTLEDENGESYKVKFLPGAKNIFSGGWMKFSAVHKLAEGDVIVFHLFRPCYFKVYIIRVDNPIVVGSTNLTNSDVNANKGKNKRKCEAADRKSPHLDTDQGSVKRSPLLSSNPSLEPGLEHSSTKESQSSSGIEACTLSGSDSDFKNFKITVNGDIVDPELSTSTRFKYYELCCSQKSYLHEHLVKYVNRALAAGIITGTLEVAEAIGACKFSTSKDDFATWENTLQGFETLGMEVGFLRERLKHGVWSLESDKLKKCVEVEKKVDSLRQEMRMIEGKFLELKRTTEKLEDEVKAMKADILHGDDGKPPQ